MIPVTCTRCGAYMEVAEQFSGRSWTCGACGQQLLVLGDSQQPATHHIPPMPQAPAPPASGKAIASLVLGLLTLFQVGFCLTGIAGILLGQSAQHDIRHGLRSGQEMARAGILLSVLGMLIPVAFIGVLFLFALSAELAGR